MGEIQALTKVAKERQAASIAEAVRAERQRAVEKELAVAAAVIAKLPLQIKKAAMEGSDCCCVLEHFESKHGGNINTCDTSDMYARDKTVVEWCRKEGIRLVTSWYSDYGEGGWTNLYAVWSEEKEGSFKRNS
jgi:hypothetical protein